MNDPLHALTQRVRRDLPDVPARFAPDLAASRAYAAPLVFGMDRGIAREPTLAQWTHLAHGLTLGDPLADAVAADMMRNRSKHWRDFERALAAGIDAVDTPSHALVELFHSVRTLPAWADPATIRVGAGVCALGGDHGMAALLVLGLAGGYRLSAINQTLIATGQLRGSAAKRIGYTTRWFLEAIADNGLEPDSISVTSTLRVRMIHALVRQRMARQDWDTGQYGVPINQVDMQATYLGFCAVYLVGLQLMGVVTTLAEREACLHRWRVLGWLLGVREDYLHANDQAWTHARLCLYHNTLQQAPADETGPLLARPLMLDEPLERSYRRVPWLAGRYTRAKQLSLARIGLRRSGMAELGLPTSAWPWYPASCFLYNQVLHRAARTLPGGRDWLVRRGMRQQLGVLDQVGAAGPTLHHGAGSPTGG